MTTCRSRLSYAEPDGPPNRCGQPVAGFVIYLDPTRVRQLLEAPDDEPVPDVEPIPIGYCAAHLDVNPTSEGWAAGSAVGAVYIVLERAPAATS